MNKIDQILNWIDEPTNELLSLWRFLIVCILSIVVFAFCLVMFISIVDLIKVKI